MRTRSAAGRRGSVDPKAYRARGRSRIRRTRPHATRSSLRRARRRGPRTRSSCTGGRARRGPGPRSSTNTQRTIVGKEPPEPRRERRTELDRERSWHVAGGEAIDRPHVDELGSAGDQSSDLVGREVWKRRQLAPVHPRSAPVHLAQAEEVPRVACRSSRAPLARTRPRPERRGAGSPHAPSRSSSCARRPRTPSRTSPSRVSDRPECRRGGSAGARGSIGTGLERAARSARARSGRFGPPRRGAAPRR